MARIVCGSALLAGIVFMFGACSGGMAQTRPLEPVGQLVERLTDTVPTSGLLLAGVHWGKSSDKFRTGNLGLQLFKSPQPRNVCVRIATRDGRYRGLAAYVVPPNPDNPSRLQFKSQYTNELEQMPASDFAIKAVVVSECGDAASGVIIPAVVGAEPSPQSLIVFLSPNDATARARIVSRDGKPLSGDPVRCQSAGPGTRIAYSHTCEVSLTDPTFSGRAILEIILVELTEGRSVKSYEIEIPSR
jgi:hypothetical protein